MRYPYVLLFTNARKREGKAIEQRRKDWGGVTNFSQGYKLFCMELVEIGNPLGKKKV
jgi:hypothetical protein